MPSFPLLDIAIGLIFVYLLLSLICSSLNEGLESLLHNRANDLEAGIRNLLGDQKGSWWASFVPWINSIENAPITREFYRHPLIRGLVRSEKRLPAYIPARDFALAVMDLAVKDGALIHGATNNPEKSALTAIPFVDDLNGSALPAQLKESIGALVRAAAGDARQARVNIENWFNSSMDRVAGWYKSRTQMILFVIGVVVTIWVNGDSLAIYQNLTHSKNLQAVVSAAQSAVGQGSAAAVVGGGNAQGAGARGTSEQIDNALSQLNTLDIGVGWASESQQKGTIEGGRLPPSFSGSGCVVEQGPCKDPIGWSFYLLYLHAIGWLITAAAISLGAPFWFDVLNRFIVVRSTIKPKEGAAESGTSK